MNNYNCKIVADSCNTLGNRITTFELTYPRIVHAELMTHRLFSRNAASSRAVPVKKMIESVRNNMFTPLAVQKAHKGMQGSDYFEGVELEQAKQLWIESAELALQQAEKMEKFGITKQLINRILEPYQYYQVLVTATEWENFFSLRCPKYSFGKNTENPRLWKSRKDAIKDFPDWESRNDFFWQSINDSQAEIHIQKIAEMMWDEINSSKPKILQWGEWHVPYGDNLNDLSENLVWDKAINSTGFIIESPLVNAKLKIATARAARISYTTLGDNPKIDYEADIRLHDKLLESKHLSCFEHCAKVMDTNEFVTFVKGQTDYLEIDEPNAGEIVSYNKVWNHDKEAGWCNNFRGFINYRYILENQ